MTEKNRTDLPHDQVAQDNDGITNTLENDLLDRPEGNGFNMEQEDTNLTEADAYEDAPYAAEVTDPDEYEDDFLNGKTYLSPEDYNEESAAEIAPNINRVDRSEDTDNPVNEEQVENIRNMEVEETGNTALGWTALVLSIISLFFLPVLAGTIGVVTGFFAFRNGARSLGGWAMAIGAFSIILSLFISPFVR